MARGNLLTRDDTFLGVCEGLGQDLGIPANLLRLSFAGLLFVNPMLTIAGYLALGGLVFLSRLIFPDRPRASTVEPAAAPAAPAAEAPAEAEAQVEEPRELIAA